MVAGLSVNAKNRNTIESTFRVSYFLLLVEKSAENVVKGNKRERQLTDCNQFCVDLCDSAMNSLDVTLHLLAKHSIIDLSLAAAIFFFRRQDNNKFSIIISVGFEHSTH